MPGGAGPGGASGRAVAPGGSAARGTRAATDAPFGAAPGAAPDEAPAQGASDELLASWEVTLPQRGRAAEGASAPRRARVRWATASGGGEELTLPVAVGRALARARSSEDEGPSTQGELLSLVSRTCASCAHARMEELVGVRDWTQRELADRLHADGYPTDVVRELVGRAVECGLVDDARFADVLIRSKVCAGWGERRIAQELRRRGVDPDAVEGWPEAYLPAESEHDRALALASRRRLTGKNDYARLVRFLCGRGFATGLACEVAREVLDVAAQDDEEL